MRFSICSRFSAKPMPLTCQNDCARKTPFPRAEDGVKNPLKSLAGIRSGNDKVPRAAHSVRPAAPWNPGPGEAHGEPRADAAALIDAGSLRLPAQSPRLKSDPD